MRAMTAVAAGGTHQHVGIALPQEERHAVAQPMDKELPGQVLSTHNLQPGSRPLLQCEFIVSSK